MVGYHRETQHFSEEKSAKEFTAPQHNTIYFAAGSPDKIIAALRGRFFRLNNSETFVKNAF